MNPRDCNHANRVHLGVDTEGDSVLYDEWRCDDCGAFISTVYESADYEIVQDDGDAWEIEA